VSPSYTYYPGCSVQATSRDYSESIRAVAGPLGLELVELDDWNCCGATAYMNVNEVLSFCLTARNLALAAKHGREVCTACSSCYQNLCKTNRYLESYPELREKVNRALAEAQLSYEGGVETKHLLEVVARDVGLARVQELVRRPLEGVRVAAYYGCQTLRPTGADDPERPTMLEELVAALGAEVTSFPLKTWCCGGSLMGTNEKVALRLCRNLLACAADVKAEVICVVCPLCQFNLEVYQRRVNRAYGTHFAVPVLYFTQLIGLALGLRRRELGLQRAIVPPAGPLARLVGVPA